MSNKMLHPLDIRLDGDAERARRDAAAGIKALAARPEIVPLGEFELEDGIETPINHKLGRVPLFVFIGPVIGPSTAGMIEEIRTGNRRQTLTLKASGYGATVTVGVAVM